MEDPFNPYVEWLGIAAARARPNHYALLGLKLFESDAVAIAAAYQRRVSAVRKIDAGGNEAALRQVLAELATARRTLSDSVQKQRYDERLRQHAEARKSSGNREHNSAKSPQARVHPAGVNLLPPATTTTRVADEEELDEVDNLLPPMSRPLAGSEPQAAADADPPVHVAGSASPEPPANQALAEPPPPDPDPAGAVSSQLATARTAARQLAIRRQRAQRFALAAVLLLLLAVGAALGVGYATGYIRIGQPNLLASGDPEHGDAPSSAATSTDETSDDAQPSESPTKGKHESLSPTSVADQKQNVGTPTTGVRPAHRGEPPTDDKSMPPRDSAEMVRRKTDVVESAPPPDEAQIAKFQAALSAARLALGAREFESASQHIAEAKQLAASKDQRELADAITSLKSHVEEFWKAVGEGFGALEKSGELEVGSTVVSVVEVADEHLVIRVNGQNRRYKRDQLPAGLAVAIAKKWFDERPENKVILGSFYFVDPRTDVDEAKRLWEEAGSSGVEVGDLMALLPIAKDTSNAKKS